MHNILKNFAALFLIFENNGGSSRKKSIGGRLNEFLRLACDCKSIIFIWSSTATSFISILKGLLSNWKYCKHRLKSWKQLLNSYLNVKKVSANLTVEGVNFDYSKRTLQEGNVFIRIFFNLRP